MSLSTESAIVFRAGFVPLCLEMFREHQIVAWPPDGEFSLPKIAAAWALLVLDRDLAVEEIFRSLERLPDVFLARLLICSGSPEVEERVKGLIEDPGSWIHEMDMQEVMVDAFERAIGGIRAGLEPGDYWIWE